MTKEWTVLETQQRVKLKTSGIHKMGAEVHIPINIKKKLSVQTLEQINYSYV